MQALASRAYGQVHQRTAESRHIEHALFDQITVALEAVSLADRPEPSDWADAIHRNQQLWTTLATDLMLPENGLPQTLKESLLYLAEFVRRESNAAIAGERGLADLIDVNRAVMAGLMRHDPTRVVSGAA